ncbi:MAG: hypothetical protein AAFW74_15605 [Pseudomonadota bacterium]
MNAFFFGGSYPLALQLGIINALCVIAIVLMRALPVEAAHDPRFTRIFAWLIIAANVLLVLNKDHRFVGFLA